MTITTLHEQFEVFKMQLKVKLYLYFKSNVLSTYVRWFFTKEILIYSYFQLDCIFDEMVSCKLECVGLIFACLRWISGYEAIFLICMNWTNICTFVILVSRK